MRFLITILGCIAIIFAFCTLLGIYFNVRLAIDFQKDVCIGRFFLYKLNDKDLSEAIDLQNICQGQLIALKLKTQVFPYDKGVILIKRCIATSNMNIFITANMVKVCDAVSATQCVEYQRKFADTFYISPNYFKTYKLNTNELFILGDSPNSVDSKIIGPVKLEDVELLGEAYALF